MTRAGLLAASVLGMGVVGLSQELETSIRDRAQLAAIRALIERHAPGARVFRITEVPVLPTFGQWVVRVQYDKKVLNAHRYTYKLLELARPTERGRGYDATHPFTYSLNRQTDATGYDVYAHPRVRADISVASAIPDATVDRVVAFIEKQGDFTYSRVAGHPKTLKASEILSTAFSISTGDAPGTLHVDVHGHSLTLKLRVLPTEIKLEGVRAYVI
jgi:hypothetical protein